MATALIKPLAREPTYAAGVALKGQKTKKKKKNNLLTYFSRNYCGIRSLAQIITHSYAQKIHIHECITAFLMAKKLT